MKNRKFNLIEALESRDLFSAVTYSVTNTNDAGAGSLREAITQANLTVDTDRIEFDIAGAGVHTISLLSALPELSSSVEIDGYTQTGAAVATTGTSASIMIELDGLGANVGYAALRVAGGNSTISGLSIKNFKIANQQGILITGTGGNTITGNYIGTDATGGLFGVGNSVGIKIDDSAGNTIGGASAADRNVISANASSGIQIDGNDADGNFVYGNTIGLTASGVAVLGNNVGILVALGNDNVIGGVGLGNVISGNANSGISLAGNGAITVGTVVQGNYIGTDISGMFDLGNAASGISVFNGSGNTIGGLGAGEMNVISGNNTDGVSVSFDSDQNSILGNLIGVDVTGLGVLGNSHAGIGWGISAGLEGDSNTVSSNVIAGNGRYGVLMAGVNNVVQSNFIGTDAAGVLSLGNGWDGVLLSSANNNAIGGLGAGEGNVIVNNGRAGIQVDFSVGASVSTGNALLSNSIYNNGGLAITLDFAGVTANDLGDGDAGANNLQNFPVLTSVTRQGSTFTATGTLNSAANSTYTIQVYGSSTGDVSGHGEAEFLIGTATVVTDASGDASYSLVFNASVSASAVISATATDAAGNTSEMSLNIVPVVLPDNAAPVVTSLSGPNLGLRGEQLDFVGTFVDPDVGDTHTQGWVVTDSSSLVVASGSGSTIGYLATTLGNYTVTYTVTDAEGASDSASVNFAIANALPVVTGLTGPSNGTRGETLQFVGSFVDTDTADTHVESWVVTDSLAGVVASGSGSSIDFVAGLLGNYTVTYTVTDVEGGVASSSLNFVIDNVAPSDAAIAGPVAAIPGQALDFVGTFTDPDVGDTHVEAWVVTDDLGTVVASGAGSLITYTTSVLGTYTVSYTVTDGEGASDTASTSLVVSQVAVIDDPHRAGDTLFITGTESSDWIRVRPSRSVVDAMEVIINHVSVGHYDMSGGLDHVVIYALGGNDRVRVSSRLAVSAEIYGGDGHDFLVGGSGDDALFGGAGHDILIGKSGRDLLVGGTGSDWVLGNNDDDILVGGSYLQSGDRGAVTSVVSRWGNRTMGYTDRIADLSVGAIALNSTTVEDDCECDVLLGLRGLDWFHANTSDDYTDERWYEQLTEDDNTFLNLDE